MSDIGSLIDRCPNAPACNGRIRIVSLSRDERIRRRLGQAMIGKCERCGAETTVNKRAWATFARDRRRQETAAKAKTALLDPHAPRPGIQRGLFDEPTASEIFRFENPFVDDNQAYEDE